MSRKYSTRENRDRICGMYHLPQPEAGQWMKFWNKSDLDIEDIAYALALPEVGEALTEYRSAEAAQAAKAVSQGLNAGINGVRALRLCDESGDIRIFGHKIFNRFDHFLAGSLPDANIAWTLEDVVALPDRLEQAIKIFDAPGVRELHHIYPCPAYWLKDMAIGMLEEFRRDMPAQHLRLEEFMNEKRQNAERQPLAVAAR